MTPKGPEQRSGRIVTFYSYKGGTGRSMAVANVGWLLASAGKRVLMIDWDLEAPGLHRYFHPFLDDAELSETPGIIDWAIDVGSAARQSAGVRQPPVASAGGWLALAWSPDGSRIAVAGEDGVDVRDASSGTQQLALTDHSGAVLSVAWSPDGAHLATASVDNTVRLWDTTTGTQQLEFTGHTDWVRAVAWSPDGTRLATASDDNTARLWDTTTGTQQLPLTGHIGAVLSVAWSPDGTRLATASGDNTARLWDTTTGAQQLDLTGHIGAVLSVAWSPDGTRLATASGDYTARVWDTTTGTQQLELTGRTGPVLSVAWSPNGTRLATASDDKTARVWDTTTGTQQLALTGHTDWVRAVAWSPDGTRLATASNDKTARVWDTVTGTELAPVVGANAMARAVAWSSDGARLATAGDDKTARLWDTTTGTQQLALAGHIGAVLSVAWSPDGTRLATASGDNTARLWDTTNGTQQLALTGHTSWVLSVAWSPDGTHLATASADKTARLWDHEGTLVATLQGHTNQVYSIKWSPDGSNVLTGSLDGTVRIWTREGGMVSACEAGVNGVIDLGWAHDGDAIVAAGLSGSVAVLAVQSDGSLAGLDQSHSLGPTWLGVPQWWHSCTTLLPYTVPINFEFPSDGALELVPAGVQDAGYATRVTKFDWEGFYSDLGGGLLIEALKGSLRNDYDYVLIDSRTGISDTSGICTVHLPDDLVVCFTMNNQSMIGASAVASSVERQRTRDTGEPGIRIWPVPTRVELGEDDRLNAARHIAIERFGRYLRRLPRSERSSYWGRIEMVYKPIFAYEEVLATISESRGRTLSVLSAMEELANRIHGTPLDIEDLSETDRLVLLDRFRRPIAPSTPSRPLVYLSYPHDESALATSIIEIFQRNGLDT